MKFIIKNVQKENVLNLMRKIGYYFQREDKQKSESIFIRPLNNDYPRFHIYLKVNPETQEISFNLHLDQKRPIYKGTTAHSGEYDGSVVENETERIKQIIQ